MSAEEESQYEIPFIINLHFTKNDDDDDEEEGKKNIYFNFINIVHSLEGKMRVKLKVIKMAILSYNGLHKFQSLLHRDKNFTSL